MEDPENDPEYQEYQEKLLEAYDMEHVCGTCAHWFAVTNQQEGGCLIHPDYHPTFPKALAGATTHIEFGCNIWELDERPAG